MAKSYDQLRQLGAELLAIHVECSKAGTVSALKKHNLPFPMANDERLEIVDKYSPTSTYLIDQDGVIRALWRDKVHQRVTADDVVAAVAKLVGREIPPAAEPEKKSVP